MTHENQIGDSGGGVPEEWSLAGTVVRVQSTIDRYGLLAPGDRVLVACSGGPDSVALLALLLRCEMALELVVAHVDHGLRPDSAQDAEAVAALAASCGLPFVQRRVALVDHSSGEQPGRPVSEDTARQARLAALDGLAQEADAVRIAMGHTADDQLETLLMRLCRGAGLTGLAGMAPRRGMLVRPLLELGRQDVLATLTAVGWMARTLEDPSNRFEHYFRNRVRRDVVPLLKRENPRLLKAVTRSALGLREELEALGRYEDQEWRELVASDPLGVAVHAPGLAALPPGMASRLVRRLWRTARQHLDPADNSPAELTRGHVETVLSLLSRDTGPRVDLPGGVVAYRQYELLVAALATKLADPGDIAVTVDHAGVYPLPALGVELTAETESNVTSASPWGLTVRNLRPGDRLSMRAGTRKLSDLLVDRKVPRAQRRHLALVALQGEIAWIPDVWHKDGVVSPAGEGVVILAGPGVRLSIRATPKA